MTESTVERSLRGGMGEYLESLVEQLRPDRSGEPAGYTADLPGFEADPLAVATCTPEGTVDGGGDEDLAFALQSISKAFTYALVLEELGLPEVSRRVGVEPSGEAFNEMSLEAGGRPFNPLINAGAITVHGMVPGDDEDDRIAVIRRGFSALAGRELDVDHEVYDAEMRQADRNLSIAHMLASHSILPDEPHEVVRGYSLQCALAVTARDLAVMGATLAAGGVNPLTGERVLRPEVVRQTLSVMTTCGMYDASGDWVARVGVPAKSGVSGGIVGAVPGRLGFAAYSPRLDAHSHSVRGIQVCERLSVDWDLHLMRVPDLPSRSRTALLG